LAFMNIGILDKNRKNRIYLACAGNVKQYMFKMVLSIKREH